MYAADPTDLTDAVLDTVRTVPGLTVARIAKRLRVDAGAVRRSIGFLATEHYVALTKQGGRDVCDPIS